MQTTKEIPAAILKDWKAIYKSKLVTAEEAVKVVKSGNRLAPGCGYGEPEHLMAALVDRANELRDVEVVSIISFSKGLYAQSQYADSFKVNAFFVGAHLRKAYQEKRADYTPCHFSECARALTEGEMPVDVVLLQVSPPNEEGYCSYGLSVAYSPDIVERSGAIILAQVNKYMPWTYPLKVHVSQFDYIVEHDSPLHEQTRPPISDLDRTIAGYIAELIPDGATLQIGVGGLPEAVLANMKHKKELGIHSEGIGDTVVDLVHAGVVTGSRKTIDKGKVTATFLMGTKKLWDFVDNNPAGNVMPSAYTNNPYIISQFDNLISINAALSIDLTGQVDAETIGPVQYSGTGGQADFIRGASRSKGGKSIIALPSTAAGGKISRISLDLPVGSAITTPRTDVQYVVTEFGVAYLRGKGVRQRAKSLIEIAHPDFRAELTRQAVDRGLL